MCKAEIVQWVIRTRFCFPGWLTLRHWCFSHGSAKTYKHFSWYRQELQYVHRFKYVCCTWIWNCCFQHRGTVFVIIAAKVKKFHECMVPAACDLRLALCHEFMGNAQIVGSVLSHCRDDIPRSRKLPFFPTKCEDECVLVSSVERWRERERAVRKIACICFAIEPATVATTMRSKYRGGAGPGEGGSRGVSRSGS